MFRHYILNDLLWQRAELNTRIFQTLCSTFLNMFMQSLEDYLGAWRGSRCTRINDLKKSLPTIPLHYLLSGHYIQISISILVVRLYKSQEIETCFSNYNYLSLLAESYMAIVLILFILFIQSGFFSLRMRWHFFWVNYNVCFAKADVRGSWALLSKIMPPDGTSISLFNRGGNWDFCFEYR